MNKWLTYINDESSNTDVDHISETVDWIFDVLEKEGLNGIDFKLVSPLQCNAEHLSTALRATWSFHQQINSWSHGLELAKKACIRQGIDLNDALFGLV